jgi:glycerophosphoryl diester phosphodiesterase
MADAPKILGTDTLRDAYPKLNSAIDNSNEAKTKADGADGKADTAIETANTAKTTADTVQSQFDQVVAEAGENNPEVVQARGEAVNLNARLNATDAQLADTPKQLAINSANKVLFFGHRGASNIAPENTIPAFEQAARLGWYGNETDAQVTSDGIWVIHHDMTVDRMTDGTGNVKDLTLAQLKALNIDTGANVSMYPNLKIPTLEEFLDVCRKYNVMPLVEIKADTDLSPYFADLIAIIRKKGIEDRVSFICGTNSNATALRSLSSKVIIHRLSTGTQTELDFLKSLGNAVADIHHTDVTQEVVQTHHAEGIPVNIWGVSNMSQVISMIDAGVDFITSDNYGGRSL